MKLVPILGEAFLHLERCCFVLYDLTSDYPYTTVPNQVQRIFRAQQLHDKKHYDERFSTAPEERANMPYIDYLRPIIADADMGLVFVLPVV